MILMCFLQVTIKKHAIYLNSQKFPFREGGREGGMGEGGDMRESITGTISQHPTDWEAKWSGATLPLPTQSGLSLAPP